jgi:hypothetical protein
MAAIAASPAERIAIREQDHGLAALIHSPAVAAALLSGAIAVVVAFVGPMLARTWQNHKKALEVRTTLATDMSRSFTVAVGAGQRVASGLIYNPTGDRARNAAVVQAAYNAGLGQWQIDGGRVSAELSARFTGNEIVHEWSLYRLAVTRFYRLSAVLPGDERGYFIGYVRSYFKHVKAVPWAAPTVPKMKKADWAVLQRSKRFSRSVEYRRTYDKLSASFISLGEAFVERMLKLHPEV